MDKMLEQLAEMLHWKKNSSYYASKLGITVAEVEELRRELKERKKQESVNFVQTDLPQQNLEYYTTSSFTKGNIEKGTLESTVTIDFEPKTIEELYSLHKVDKEQYTITNFWSKVTPSGKFTSSIFCKKRTLDDITGLDILSTLDNYHPTEYKVNTLTLNTYFKNPTCLFIDITDFHLDKRDVYGTTIEDKVKEYFKVLEEITLKAYHSNKIEKIIFVIGSDFLHTDTYFNTTTKGTPQDTNTTWNNAFETAFKVYSDSILYLKQYCENLKVILVAGNHSYTKEYYLAFALEKCFMLTSNIEFDISPEYRKCVTYGNTFIMLHHGDCKQEQLPLIAAKEFPKQWGQSKYHMVITGDKHHTVEKDVQGVILKQLPAMSKADNWHNKSNYHLAERFAVGMIFDKEKGRIMDIISK